VRQGLILHDTCASGLVERAAAVLDARLDPRSPAPVAVGLSGGGDSLGLLTLVLDWAGPKGRPVLALTVDHGLSPASAGWTERAGTQARRLGAAWRSLAWKGPKPAAGLPAAARRARHALLATAAREAGASVLLLGHTADDRAEEGLLRAEGGSLGRLRAWAPSPAWPEGRGVFLCRPLLQVGRGQLRAHLQTRGLDWLDDPANDDPRFARTRARRGLAERPAPTLAGPPTPVARTGAFAIDPESDVLTLPRDPDRTVLAMALVCAAGHDRPPRGAEIDRLVARLACEGRFVAGLAGARVEADADGVQVFRETGEAARGGLAPLRIAPRRPIVWDGRFEIAVEEPSEVRPVLGLATRLSAPDRAWLSRLPAAARPGQPVLIRDSNSSPVLARRIGRVRSLVGARLRAACGEITHEREIASDARSAGRETSLC
jgi:tRNA(Ile)-lysidine synthase